MSKLRLATLVTGFVIGLAMVSAAPLVSAQSPAEQIQNGVNQVGGSEAGTTGSLEPMIKKAVNALLYVIGAVAVFMIVFGGLKYVTSRGDAAEVTSAKNTILYAVVGLVVAILAYAVVDFVTTKLGSESSKPLTAEQCQQIPVELRYHEEECL